MVQFYPWPKEDPTSWSTEGVGSYKISKWRWLWRQFLYRVGLSKTSGVIIGIDRSSGRDFYVECECKLDKRGRLQIVSMHSREDL